MAVESGITAERVEQNLALISAAARGDLDACKELLKPTGQGEWDGSADVWFAENDELGWDALHYAADAGNARVVSLLLRKGALWNTGAYSLTVDNLGFTAADIAWSRNNGACYQEILEHGVRQAFLADLLLRKTGISKRMEAEGEDAAHVETDEHGTNVTIIPGTNNEVQASNDAFLSSRLRFFRDERGGWRCLDQDDNMVMAQWEEYVAAYKRHHATLCKGAL